MTCGNISAESCNFGSCNFILLHVKSMKIVRQVFLFFHFLSAANKTWHLKLVQRDSQIGHLFAICFFKHCFMEEWCGMELQLHEFLTATQDMFSVVFQTLVASTLKKGPWTSTE
jgi:hypothetical protein